MKAFETHLLQKAGGMHPISVIAIMFQENIVIRALVTNSVVPFKRKIIGYPLLLSSTRGTSQARFVKLHCKSPVIQPVDRSGA